MRIGWGSREVDRVPSVARGACRSVLVLALLIGGGAALIVQPIRAAPNDPVTVSLDRSNSSGPTRGGGGGYWLADAGGGIYKFGDARFHGSLEGVTLTKPIVAMAATPDGRGYWLASGNGGIYKSATHTFMDRWRKSG